MRQLVLIGLGLILCALGGQGVIRLLINHNPGALHVLPGGFAVQIAAYIAMFAVGYRMARHNRVHPDPENDHRR